MAQGLELDSGSVESRAESSANSSLKLLLPDFENRWWMSSESRFLCLSRNTVEIAKEMTAAIIAAK